MYATIVVKLHHMKRCKKDLHDYTGNRCKECKKLSNAAWYKDNAEKYKIKTKQWQQNNKEKCRNYSKKWNENNKEKQNLYYKQWAIENPDYRKNRRKSDPQFAMAERLRSRVTQFFKYNKNKKTQELLGCSFNMFISHLEGQFLSGMCWENRHLWEIDHIIPLSSAKDIVEMEKLCHYTNLRPLWVKDNRVKSNKILYV